MELDGDSLLSSVMRSVMRDLIQLAGPSLHEEAYINNLPDELLGSIFLFNALRSNSESSRVRDRHSTTLRTILVCKRWYMAGMNYPALWIPIIDYENHSLTHIKELLQRSKSTPLDVGEGSAYKQIKLPKDRSALPVLECVFGQTPRIRTLNLEIGTYLQWDYICEKFLQRPAPSLEYLNFEPSNPQHSITFYSGLLFSDDAPNLRRLHLRRFILDFTSSVLFDLTELIVSNILGAGYDLPINREPTVSNWIRILQQMPMLEYLNFSHAFRLSEHIDFPSTAHLPSLRCLTVVSSLEASSVFLNQLSISKTCSIRLRITGSGPDLDSVDVPKLLSFFRTQLGYWPQDTNDRTITVDIADKRRICFGNSRYVYGDYTYDPTGRITIEDHSRTSKDPYVGLDLSPHHEDALALLNQLLGLYKSAYPATTTLYLNAEDGPTLFLRLGPSLDSVWHSFTAVKILDLSRLTALHVLPFFQSLSLPDRPLFPQLRCLRLTSVNFEHPEGHTLYLAVANFLNWRVRILKPLHEVQFVRPEFRDSKILAGAVIDLECIGGVEVTTVDTYY